MFYLLQLDEKDVDPRRMQINLTGFLNGKNARIFMGELWAMLDSAQKSERGIPQVHNNNLPTSLLCEIIIRLIH